MLAANCAGAGMLKIQRYPEILGSLPIQHGKFLMGWQRPIQSGHIMTPSIAIRPQLRGLGFAFGKHRLPPSDAGFIEVKEPSDIFDAETICQQKQSVGHTRLQDFGVLGVQGLQESFAVPVGKVHR